MNVKSKYDTDTEVEKPPKKRYYWLGYGQVNDTCGRARMMGGVWDTKTFDIIFEKLGLKKKIRRHSEEEM